MSHLLSLAASSFPEFIFRGGTALARAYWPDFRLSEDLDFISEHPVSDFQQRLEAVVAEAAQATGRDLTIESSTLRSGWWQSIVVWAGGTTKLDVNTNERAHLPASQRKLELPYSDLSTHGRELAVVAVEEILGNKWFILDDRWEPRDLFDVWWGLARAGITFAELADGHRAKYGYGPQRIPARAARRLKSAWDQRLAHQLRELPEFDGVLAEVTEAYDAWSGRRRDDRT
ncbi:MAG: nucleotidyl transferase AbiEii/AbiGii toxin family protein [Actinomycetota bacterium]|nr:nucleotidyl transferase AbiEii/AbiGii toxin family protein [Actinomycetota bacterium]